ncbi:glutamate ABC transporter substrate-binding protein [Streptomyces cavernae]|uniref:glutamate ABC transporter substrate-binding protein n=1 Tax=Streptomyces cavernae TaxID=2259034 RepID=UPI000FEBAB54|nr:glutamate ABC transporter substrate-binding protein [Streptomyces cavernae]
MIVRRTVLSALGCLVLGACGPAGEDGSAARFPKDSTMARIRERGVLTVGIKFDLPLFGYKDPSTGWITGFDADIARMVAQDLTGSEHNIRFIETMPRNREDFLDRGVVDIVVATYSISDERRKLVDFTDPYYYSGQDVLVRNTDTDMRTVADLAGKAVCTGARSTPLERLKARLRHARLVVVDNYSECVSPLLEGRIDAISTDDSILLGLMSEHPDSLRLLGSPFGRESYGIGVRRGDSAFRGYLNGLIRRFLTDGGWDEVFRNTIGVMGVSPKTAKPTPSR